MSSNISKRFFLISLTFSALILVLGYLSFGFWTMMIFSSGFLGGFILWNIFPSKSSFQEIKLIYLTTLFLFLVHRIEEYKMNFFDRLSQITNIPKPEAASLQIILLVLLSVGGWLTLPFWMKRNAEFGNYLAWTFFAAMGVTELAHFIFPIFENGEYGYFPGMASVILLAPISWWGMYKLSKKS